ncbi:hypothetical protein Glove_87g197 [Diversispora epigaea]|uniref:Protein kinase domain-containing protein n=1 Tax=Diversispora epigaea TaxID=1348612 RepID=A0A397JAD5_9GLOM|nr:hypothetical protein Glove_87g197 [Diversispora epigaea]
MVDGVHGSVYSAKLENGIEADWNFIEQDWKYYLIDEKVNQFEFSADSADYYGILKNPSTQNYIIVMKLFDENLHNFLTNTFWNLRWQAKINILASTALDLSLCNPEIVLFEPIPYIPPEGDIYSFGGIMYELVHAQQPFADQAHDTYLMIDCICNGVRPKVPDFMLNWIPKWYLDLMYRCWSDDPSERPTAVELDGLFREAFYKLYRKIVDNKCYAAA